MPYKAAQGYTRYLMSDPSRKPSGADAIVVTTKAMAIGTSLFANFYVILAWSVSENIKEKM